MLYQQNMVKSVHLYMLRFKVISVVLHLAGWILFMIFPLLFVNSNEGETVIRC